MKHVLTMANLKLKPSLFTPRPTLYARLNYNRLLEKQRRSLLSINRLGAANAKSKYYWMIKRTEPLGFSVTI